VLPILRDGLSGLTGFLSFLRDNPVVTTILLGIGSAIAIAAAAQWAWNAASLANPTTWIIMAIVAAIGLLVAAIVFLVNNWENVTAVFANGLGQINAWWNDTVGAFTNGGAQIGDFFGGLFSGIGAWGAQTWANLSTGIANTVQTIVDMITWASNEVAQFVSFGTAQKIKAPKVPGSSKKVPGMATGGHVTQGGLSWVGEEGPELLYMSPGANIVPNDVSEQLAGGSGRGGDTFVFNNPVAEPSSLSVAKRRDEIAAALSL